MAMLAREATGGQRNDSVLRIESASHPQSSAVTSAPTQCMRPQIPKYSFDVFCKYRRAWIRRRINIITEAARILLLTKSVIQAESSASTQLSSSNMLHAEHKNMETVGEMPRTCKQPDLVLE